MSNKSATNTIFLIQTVGGAEEIVETFEPNEKSKSPKRALTKFLNSVLGDPNHTLYGAAASGELSYMSGHRQIVSLRTQQVVTL